MTPEQKLIDLRAYAEQNDVPILTPEAENVFIAMLKASGAKRILEVGTAIGYSGTVSLLVTEDSHLFTIEIDEERAEMARKTFADFELTPRVTQFIGDAGDILQKLTGEYDFILLDGPKGQYLNYLPYLIEHLSVGGLLFADNVSFHGLVSEEDQGHKNRTLRVNMLGFMQAIQQDERLITEILSYGDGIALCYRKPQ